MNKKMIALFLFFNFSLFICLSYSDLYPLSELNQAKKDEEVRIDDATQNMVPPAIGMIKEIEIQGGVQKYIYVGLGTKTKGIKVGLKAWIFNDPQMKEKVGKAEIVEIYSDISKLKILEINYKIDAKGVVAVEVDPRNYIE
jgi:hypothetical protein